MSTGDISVSDTYLGELSFDAQEAPIINCFAKGTKILTPTGERNIEDLCAGDAVQTVDNEVQHIRWVGKSILCSEQLRAFPNLCPIKISAGALGKNSPTRDLTVSPHHRILVRSKIAERMFGTAEVLIPAIKLVELSGISQVLDVDGIEYYHMLFDKHEIVFSEGAETESLYTGKQALMAIGPEAYEEVTTLFPEIADPDYVPHAARTIPQGKKMKELTARHVKNNKPLVNAL